MKALSFRLFLSRLLAALLLFITFTTAFSQPFTLVSPNGPSTRLFRNSPVTVVWSGGNKQGRVSILLSTNGGTTYSTTLASNLPAAIGSHTVVFPNLFSSSALVRIVNTLPTSVRDSGKIATMSNPVPIESTVLGCNYCAPTTLASSFNFTSIEILNASGSSVLSSFTIPSTIVTTSFIDFYASHPSLFTLPPGNYQFRFTMAGMGSKSVGVWADFNFDCNLASSTTEFLGSSFVSSGSVVTRPFTIPSSARGPLKFRFKLFNANASMSSFMSCSSRMSWSLFSTTSGQTLDFRVNVNAARREAIEEQFSTKLSHYPNPLVAGEEGIVELTCPSQASCPLMVVDALGRKVLMQDIQGKNEVQTIKLRLANGLYQILLKTPEQTLTSKWWVQ